MFLRELTSFHSRTQGCTGVMPRPERSIHTQLTFVPAATGVMPISSMG